MQPRKDEKKNPINLLEDFATMIQNVLEEIEGLRTSLEYDEEYLGTPS